IHRPRRKPRLGMMNRTGLKKWRWMNVRPRLNRRPGVDDRLVGIGIHGAHGAGDELNHFQVQCSDIEADIGRVHRRRAKGKGGATREGWHRKTTGIERKSEEYMGERDYFSRA